MCLMVIAHDCHPTARLVVAANRDEFYARPSAPAGFWDSAPQLLAGADLEAGGTWLGLTLDGRFAAVTNYREPNPPRHAPRSRGCLVTDYLLGEAGAWDFANAATEHGAGYRGFNLLLADATGLYYTSNRGAGPRRLQPGIYGLSNHLLDTPWPKVERAKAALHQRLRAHHIDAASLLPLLMDCHCPPDEDLPDTGIGLERERLLAPAFIQTQIYGTRSSTGLVVTRSGYVDCLERSFEQTGVARAERRYRFSLLEPAGRRSALPGRKR